jgi:hypothetical protein
MTDMQTSLPLLIVRSSIINLVINFSTHLWPVKWKCPIGYTFVLCIPFYHLRCQCNTYTNQSPKDMIHFISSRDRIGSSIMTSLALHRCLGPSVPSYHLTCPSYLQPVHRAKSCFDLLHLDHMTPCHVSYAVSSIITCVSFATSLSHFHLHGICCSHTCTYGLITCVSHNKHILVHLVLPLNYQNQTRTFHIVVANGNLFQLPPLAQLIFHLTFVLIIFLFLWTLLKSLFPFASSPLTTIVPWNFWPFWILKDLPTWREIVRCDSSKPLYPLRLLAIALHASTSPSLWHQHLGDPGHEVLSKLAQSSAIPCNKSDSDTLCHAC